MRRIILYQDGGKPIDYLKDTFMKDMSKASIKNLMKFAKALVAEENVADSSFKKFQKDILEIYSIRDNLIAPQGKANIHWDQHFSEEQIDKFKEYGITEESMNYDDMADLMVTMQYLKDISKEKRVGYDFSNPTDEDIKKVFFRVLGLSEKNKNLIYNGESDIYKRYKAFKDEFTKDEKYNYLSSPEEELNSIIEPIKKDNTKPFILKNPGLSYSF